VGDVFVGPVVGFDGVSKFSNLLFALESLSSAATVKFRFADADDHARR